MMIIIVHDSMSNYIHTSGLMSISILNKFYIALVLIFSDSHFELYVHCVIKHIPPYTFSPP